MLTLQPGEYFGIVRQLADPNDTGAYYVRAVIRNARTDANIDTVNLTDRASNQRHSAQWQVTSVGAAGGLFISITTYVYTDSGYTTLSTDYSAEENTYLVDMRVVHVGGTGGASLSTATKVLGGYLDKNWKMPDVEKLLRELVDTFRVEILDSERRIITAIAEIEPDVVNVQATDLSPVIRLIDSKEYAPTLAVPMEEITRAIEASKPADFPVDVIVKGIADKIAEVVTAHLQRGVDGLKDESGKIVEILSKSIVQAMSGDKEDGSIRSPAEIIRGLRASGKLK